MNIKKTVKGIAVGSSLAAFVTLGVPAVSSAANLLGQPAKQVGEKKGKKDDKKKDDKKKDDKKEKGEGEGSCGEGSCGEGACGEGSCGGKDKDKKK